MEIPSGVGRIHLAIPKGAYLTGTSDQGGLVGVYKDDPGFNPAYFRADVNMFGLQGTMPLITDGADPAQGVGKWGDGALAVYPREGYRKGGVGAGEIKVSPAQLQSADPAFIPANIKAGVSIYGVTGNLSPSTATGVINLGNIAPTSATANGISWSMTPNIGAGKTIIAATVYCQASTTYYVATSLFSGLRLHQSATWIAGAPSRSSIISSTAGGQVMVNCGGITTLALGFLLYPILILLLVLERLA